MQKKPDDTKASKRILLVAPSPAGRGGISSMVNTLYQSSLSEQYIFSWLPTQNDQSKIKSLLMLISALFKAPWFIIKADCVHIHSSSYNSFRRKSLFALWAILLKKKYIMHIHSGRFPLFMQRVSSIEQKVYTFVLRHASTIITLSSVFERTVSQYSPPGNKQSHYIVPNPGRFRLQKSTDDDISSITVLYCGWLEKSKGIFDLLQAFSQCADSDWRLIMAGNGRHADLRKAAEQLNISDQVQLLEWQTAEQLKDLYSRSTLLALPSYAEAMPMVILEAMAFGLPVVATPVGAIPEMLPPEANQFLHAPGDIEALTNHITNICRNKQLQISLRKIMQNHFLEHFTIEKVQAQIDEIYQENTSA